MPHMADGPEQLEVENQCPTVSHNDVSRKHNTDVQYTLGKSWQFIANFNPEDISHHLDVMAPRGMRCAETKNRALL